MLGPGQAVSRSELVKGFEYEVEERELDQIALRSSRVMEVVECVVAAEVIRSTWMRPIMLAGRAVEKPYTLLYEALRRAGYAALAQWTLHNREHLVLLRPGRFGLLVHTLFYADEVRALDEFRTETEWVAPPELELAHRLIQSLAGPFEPAKYRDTYRQNLGTLIDTKIRGEEVKLDATRPVLHPVPDILEALKASLSCAKKPALVAELQPAPKRSRRAIAS